MPDSPPRITRADTPEGPCALLQGRWGAAEMGSRAQWRTLSRQLAGLPAQPDLGWDLRGLQWLDHVGAQLLWNHWGRAWPQRLALTPGQRALLERAERYSTTAPPAEPWRTADQVDRLGVLVLHGVDHARHLLVLVGQLALDLLRLLRAPRRGPWRDISGHLYRMGATALPITALVGFLIGVVLAYLMSLQLRQFGAESFIVNILGISLIRELGPMLAAILVAGRSGSAITAQIGVMRVTEELDAMRVMGIAHGFRLVLPRALALALAMPLIAVWTTLAALAGGMLAADVAMDVSPAYFAQALPRAVDAANLALALSKSVVFGVLIALIGCHWGLRVQPNTQSLGAGTTASVVNSITMVIVVDALFAVAFKNVGI
ncbi:ABC transporter permease [Acidovorax sp. SRB_14]|uniref:MlaE family ABC transporter permease n=1 Tax=Acidovorax sp. SRB_14 TaxID=1962699 RepID=UPI00146BEC0A|nr:ABC transporter permease [Acidovorax sp. SRB_14]NMM82389.1 ABC transporter permease [Acidovorax sp. SRB_14]NMM91015.1 ABC transporter permease [Rhodococcus sp. SRB_17]